MHALQVAVKRTEALLECVRQIEQAPGIEPIHELRVACRRFQQGLDLLDDYVSKKTRRQARRAAGRLRRCFGPLRDADVLMDLLQQWLMARQRRTASEFVAVSALLHQIALQRRTDTPLALKALHHDDARDWIATLKQLARDCNALWLAHSQDRDEAPVEGSPPEATADPVLEGVRASREAVREILAQGPLDTSSEGLEHAHELRIAIKSYRYAVEALAARLPSEGAQQKLLKPFKVIQESLGVVQDNHTLLKHIDHALAALDQGELPKCLEHIDLRDGYSRLRHDLLGQIQKLLAQVEQLHHTTEKHIIPLIKAQELLHTKSLESAAHASQIDGGVAPGTLIDGGVGSGILS